VCAVVGSLFFFLGICSCLFLGLLPGMPVVPLCAVDAHSVDAVCVRVREGRGELVFCVVDST
jgi:hypothetical protein